MKFCQKLSHKTIPKIASKIFNWVQKTREISKIRQITPAGEMGAQGS